MNKRFKLLLLSTVISSALHPVSLLAQETAAPEERNSAESEGIEVIMVTATKRSESLQDIPLSVTSFSQKDMDIKGASSMFGIQESTPNLNFSVQSAGQNVARVTLRGIGTETLVGGGDPGVALHIDGVYVGRNSAAAGDVFDVERLEILRGPQGTLYGRNATGGSVNIITQKPTDEIEGYADLTLGNYNERSIRAVANVPLNDNLSSRLTVFSKNHDGYVENLFENGRDSNDKDSNGGRLQLLYKTDSGNEYLLKGYYSKTGGVGPGAVYLGKDIDTPNGYPGNYIVGISEGPTPPPGAPILADAFGLGTTAGGDSILPRPTDLHQMRKDAPEFVDMLIQGVDFEANVNIADDILLKAITSYQTNDNMIFVDADNSELPIETRARNNMAKQYSQEINLISQSTDPFQWIIGAYYYHEELIERFDSIKAPGGVPIDTPLPPGSVPGGGGVNQLRITAHEVDSAALFAQLSYELSDQWSVTGGMRYTKDSKDQSRAVGGQVDVTNNRLFMGRGAFGRLPADSGSTSFSEVTYRFSTDYKLTDTNMVFASYAKGYKSGGFDFNGGVLEGDEQVPYDPEFVKATEIGSKNRLFDNNMILNITAFHYDYEDLQVFRLTGSGPLTDNAAQSTITGLEVEFKIQAGDNLKFDGSFGYLDATYDEYTIDIPPTDFSGNRLNYAPEYTGHLGTEYTMTLDEAFLTARLDWSYRSDTFFDRSNNELDTQEAYSLINARLRYDAELYYIDLWARNLGDESYVTGQLINPPFACNCRTVNVGAPRTFGVTLGARF
jgi:iron complex outermembrane receptor protein